MPSRSLLLPHPFPYSCQIHQLLSPSFPLLCDKAHVISLMPFCPLCTFLVIIREIPFSPIFIKWWQLSILLPFPQNQHRIWHLWLFVDRRWNSLNDVAVSTLLPHFSSSEYPKRWTINLLSPLPFLCFFQTLISFGDYHSLMFWFSLAELRCSTPVTAQDERSFNILTKNVKDTKKEGQKGIFIEFPGP